VRPPDAERPGADTRAVSHALVESNGATVGRVPVDRFEWERAIRDSEEITGNALLVLLTSGSICGTMARTRVPPR
jgi:hypothetical protein